MPSQPAVPPLLSSYLKLPPEGSLTLLTGTLGATTNWLVLRFLASVTRSKTPGTNLTSPARNADLEVKLVLVSWLRDAAFWKDGSRRLGIDFEKVTFVDALSSGLGLGSDGIVAVEKQISQAVVQATQPDAPIILVLDGIDLLLASGACPVHDLLEVIGELRNSIHSIIVTACIDSPLLQSQFTPLEAAHAALVMSLAHQARIVMSARELDTGGARDVSGVLRTTGGGDEWRNGDWNEEESEYLYYVSGDVGVRVLGRGS